MNPKFAQRMSLVKPSAIRELLKHGSDPSIISFGGGFPDPDMFPIDKINEAASRALREFGKNALQYAATEGLLSLREKLVARMHCAGVDCSLDNLIMVQGSQQGLDLAAKMFVNPGDVIIVENPTFLGALAAFNPCMPSYRTVDMDENGMRMDQLEKILRETPNVSFIYTIPEFQNPTGVTMSLSRRKTLVELANRYDVMILEDSPYREIRFEGETLPCIKTFDTENRVIHLGSFSKILSPGMRLGWVVAEPEIAAKLALLKMAADTQNSTLNMYIADTYLEMFDINGHIEALKQVYRQKRDLMLQTMQTSFPPEVLYTHSEGGLFTWLTFPAQIDAARLMAERVLPEAKVAYVPGAPFYARKPEANHCRINYSCVTPEKIVEGITKLGEILHDELK